MNLWCAWLIITAFPAITCWAAARTEAVSPFRWRISQPRRRKGRRVPRQRAATFNKKLISNSLNILYDKLNACPDKGLVGEISGYLMLAVYKMFRLVYGAGPKNTSSMFGVKKNLYGGYSDAAMHIAESNVKAILAGEDIGLGAPLKDTSAFAMTTESLSRDYPLYATSLLNLIKTSEARIEKEK